MVQAQVAGPPPIRTGAVERARAAVDVGCTVVSAVSVGWVVLERFFLFLFFLRFVCVVDVVGVGVNVDVDPMIDVCVVGSEVGTGTVTVAGTGARSGEVDSVEDGEDGDEERLRL